MGLDQSSLFLAALMALLVSLHASDELIEHAMCVGDLDGPAVAETLFRSAHEVCLATSVELRVSCPPSESSEYLVW